MLSKSDRQAQNLESKPKRTAAANAARRCPDGVVSIKIRVRVLEEFREGIEKVSPALRGEWLVEGLKKYLES
jgi:uncharacterized protein (DUF4415 family)